MKHRAFTLVELLTVIAIMIIIMAFAIPAVTSISQAGKIAQAAQMVHDRIQLARQHAITRNRSVEVRFYKTRNSGASADSYCATAIFEVGTETGTPRQMERFEYLPSGVLIAADPQLSPLLAGTTPSQDDPRFGKNYRFLRFAADGTTAVEEGESWLSVVKESDEGNSLPKNYAVVNVVPATGIPRTFRP